MGIATPLRAAAMLLLVASGTAATQAAEVTVSMVTLALNTADYVGRHVTVSDCLMIGSNHIVGAQCSIDPINAGILVNIDADTWTVQAQKQIDDCATAIIELMCTLKVTGDVTTNPRGEAVILGATVALVKRTQAI